MAQRNGNDFVFLQIVQVVEVDHFYSPRIMTSSHIIHACEDMLHSVVFNLFPFLVCSILLVLVADFVIACLFIFGTLLCLLFVLLLQLL
jgi:hypothetical protein